MSETAIKERPILFSGEMVRSILDGKKTVTRRVVNPPFRIQEDWPYRVNPEVFETGELTFERPMPCPYGEPGDRLWVREAWRRTCDTDALGCVQYKADGAALHYLCDNGGEGDPTELAGPAGKLWDEDAAKWRPSIHMPRWASRITLEVVSVRVERLQEITHEDAIMEGCEGYDWVASSPYISGPHTDSGELPREEFAKLWDQLNAGRGYSWDSNPWVWRVEFSRLTGG